jgi:hypothetical protein
MDIKLIAKLLVVKTQAKVRFRTKLSEHGVERLELARA